jgi:hypothetical protein
MRRLYQCRATITYNYKIIVEEGQDGQDIAYACLDEVVDDHGRPRPEDISLREVKITKDLEGLESVYSCDSSFDGFMISDLLEEEFPEPEEEQL